ncbi:MAG: AAA family ATPase [Desulfovibrio sp.]
MISKKYTKEVLASMQGRVHLELLSSLDDEDRLKLWLSGYERLGDVIKINEGVITTAEWSFYLQEDLRFSNWIGQILKISDLPCFFEDRCGTIHQAMLSHDGYWHDWSLKDAIESGVTFPEAIGPIPPGFEYINIAHSVFAPWVGCISIPYGRFFREPTYDCRCSATHHDGGWGIPSPFIRLYSHRKGISYEKAIESLFSVLELSEHDLRHTEAVHSFKPVQKFILPHNSLSLEPAAVDWPVLVTNYGGIMNNARVVYPHVKNVLTDDMNPDRTDAYCIIGKSFLPISYWKRPQDYLGTFVTLKPAGDSLWFQWKGRINKKKVVLIFDSIIDAEAVNEGQDGVGSLNIDGLSCATVGWYGGSGTLRVQQWGVLEKRKTIIMLTDRLDFDDYIWLIQKLFANNNEVCLSVRNFLKDPNILHTGLRHIPIQSGTEKEIVSQFRAILKKLEFSITVGRPLSLRGEVKSIKNVAIPKEKKMLLSPVLPEKSFMLLYASSGAGKTWFALGLGMAVAEGKTFANRWKSEKPKGVLYVDGELGGEAFEERLFKIHKKAERTPPFFYKCIEDCDLSLSEDQKKIEKAIKMANHSRHVDRRIKLVILDNLTALSAANESLSDWKKIQSWIARLKEKGVAVLLVHHTSKEGKQRGHNVKTFGADIIVKLDNITQEYQSSTILCVDIEKKRHIANSEAAPFNVELKIDKRAVWTSPSLSAEEIDKLVQKMVRQNMREKDIKRAIGCSISTVQRSKRRLGLVKHREKKNEAELPVTDTIEAQTNNE